jgi:hypothetical protein
VGISSVVVFAVNSVYFKQGSEVISGSVIVNEVSAGPTLVGDFELAIGIGVTTPTGYLLAADSIKLKSGAVVNGDIYFNDLTNGGTVVGELVEGLELPVIASLPPFVAVSPRPGAEDILVERYESIELPAGDYGYIDAKQGTSILFTGGTYNLLGIDTGPGVSLVFNAPSEIRVGEKLSTSENSYVGPNPGSGISASDIIFYVAGINGTTGNLAATPKAAKIGIGNEVLANFYVPNGTLHLRQATAAEGAFLGRDVLIGPGVQLAVNSFFSNRPPVADPKDVFTDGVNPIDIILTGSDPNSDDLVFSIVTSPTQGSLGTVIQDPPPAPGDPRRTSATVTYTPYSADDVEDSFTFMVDDGNGGTGTAVVSINPQGDETPDIPPLDTVVANDVSVETATQLAITVTLSGDAPEEVSLTFSIVSDPLTGVLSDLTQGEEVPQRSATVLYSPGPDSGEDSFEFSACGIVDDQQECDTAMVMIEIFGELADDQELYTVENLPVQITLGGTPGAGGNQGKMRSIVIAGKAAWLDPAEIGGGVADSDGDGLGDTHDPLPGAEPTLTSAAVWMGATGAVSDPADDASSSVNDDPDPDVISATIASDGTDLSLSVRYAAGTFDPQLTRAQFLFDTDDNPATGHTGSDSGCSNDNGIIGAEFLVNMGANLGASASVLGYLGTCNSFGWVGNGTVSYVSDGMDATVPLSLLGGDDGLLAFKVTISEKISGSSGFTGVLDYMPDVGTDPGQTIGNPNETTARRIQIEWDLSGLSGGVDDLDSASVLLYTKRGPMDQLDTYFYVSTQNQDGQLTDADFEASFVQLANIVMPVPAVPVETEGTFSFGVLDQLRQAIISDLEYFSIQARVDEGLYGFGLQVRTTAVGNQQSYLEPQLSITTPGLVPPSLTYAVLSLPTNGTLLDAFGNEITAEQLPKDLFGNPNLTYTPDPGFTGFDSFVFQATDTQTLFVDSGTIMISIIDLLLDPCVAVGREPGCTPG